MIAMNIGMKIHGPIPNTTLIIGIHTSLNCFFARSIIATTKPVSPPMAPMIKNPAINSTIPVRPITASFVTAVWLLPVPANARLKKTMIPDRISSPVITSDTIDAIRQPFDVFFSSIIISLLHLCLPYQFYPCFRMPPDPRSHG